MKVFHVLHPSAPHEPWVKATTSGQTRMAPWTWVSPEHPEHSETLVDWALKEGIGRVIVWGGDGSFHRVVSALWRRKALDKMELGLVPNGTCNDLARRLGLSKYFWRRWEAPAPDGRLASLCLCRTAWEGEGAAGEDVFVNNAGFGRPRGSFESKEGPLGVLRSFAPIPLTATWEAGRLEGVYYMALACSAPFFSGGLYFEKEASPEDGKLRFYMVPATSKLRLALRLARGRLGLPLYDDKLTKVTAAKVRIDTRADVWPQADGEPPPEKAARTLEFSVLPDRVRLWVP